MKKRKKEQTKPRNIKGENFWIMDRLYTHQAFPELFVYEQGLVYV